MVLNQCINYKLIRSHNLSAYSSLEYCRGEDSSIEPGERAALITLGSDEKCDFESEEVRRINICEYASKHKRTFVFFQFHVWV
jgi:hypothetical protein